VVSARHSGKRELKIFADREVLPANGLAEARLKARENGGDVQVANWKIESGQTLATLQASPEAAVVQARVTPGVVTVVAENPGFRTARIRITLDRDSADQFRDGTPDFIRLQDDEDRIAFRRWFTFLAESPYFQSALDRPTEITDCAALIRFAYREALRSHDGIWANHWKLPTLPQAASIQKYDYPHTGLGSSLFRIRPGSFAPQEISDGTFAEFADAESLWRFNTHLISRDFHAARPGDLLFFRQSGHRMPFHTMIYLGTSPYTEGEDWLVYHTGPSSGQSGELRRVTVPELLRHPQAVWRPLQQNPAFLGVYRWNILREAN